MAAWCGGHRLCRLSGGLPGGGGGGLAAVGSVGSGDLVLRRGAAAEFDLRVPARAAGRAVAGRTVRRPVRGDRPPVGTAVGGGQGDGAAAAGGVVGSGGGGAVQLRRPLALRRWGGRLGRRGPGRVRPYGCGGHAGTAAPLGSAGSGVRG